MNSGGKRKLDWSLIFIEAPQAVAEVIFYNRFSRNPNYVTCGCCGSDYVIREYNTLEEATEYHRGKQGMSLDEFAQKDNVLIIPASDIKEYETKGELPSLDDTWL